MGRFYKTVNPQFLDYAYQLPQEAMLKAVEMTDARIAKNEAANEGLRSLLKLDAIDKDRGAADEILTGYQNRIDELSREIQENPLDFRRKSPQITALQREITQDFTRGDAFTIQSNYDRRLANYESMKEDFKKNPENYNYSDIEKLQAQLDSRYGGYQSGEYNVDRLREFVNINDFDTFGANYESDIIERLGAYKGADGYLYTSKDKKEFVDPNLIKQHLVDILMNDKKLNDYYGQQIQLGNITEEEYVDLLATTADRIGDKYGFSRTSSGLTSIKNDSRDAVREEWRLNNPVANTTPGTIADKPLLDKYATTDSTTGLTLDNYSISGIDSALGSIGHQQRQAVYGATTLAADNNIQLTEEQVAGLQQGDFSVLKGVQGVNGEIISPTILAGYQEQYDQLKFEQNLLTKKREVALKQEDPDAWLKLQRDEMPTIDTNNEFQFDFVNKGDDTDLQKNIKEWRTEINKSQSYFNAPLQFDVRDLQQIDPTLAEKLSDGVSIQQLISDGTIKPKTTTKKGTEPVMLRIPTEDGGFNEIPIPGEFKPEEINTSGFENFKINGNFAKPATQLDGEGNVMIQFEMEIEGNAVNVYMPENYVSNRTIKQYLDLDAMKAAHQYKEALSEGAIDEEGFMIDGVLFRKSNGKNVAFIEGQGTFDTREAVRLIANYRKAKKQKLLE